MLQKEQPVQMLLKERRRMLLQALEMQQVQKVLLQMQQVQQVLLQELQQPTVLQKQAEEEELLQYQEGWISLDLSQYHYSMAGMEQNKARLTSLSKKGCVSSTAK
jgi:hypothetical protein